MSEVISNEYDSSHQALDIVSSDHTETDIIALENGIVETVVKNIKETNHNTKGNATYGNYVKIKQTNGKTALYAHMKYGSINVNIGDFVEKGTIIGTMGETGNAYGKHLHLEIKNEQGIKENPLISLNEPIENKAEENTEENNIEETIKETEIKEKAEETNIEEDIKDIQITKEPTKKTKISKITENIHKQEETLINSTYQNGSIVDALKEINIDSSYQYRKKLALANGITNYHGTYDQNVKLLKLLKDGNLKKA